MLYLLYRKYFLSGFAGPLGEDCWFRLRAMTDAPTFLVKKKLVIAVPRCSVTLKGQNNNKCRCPAYLPCTTRSFTNHEPHNCKMHAERKNFLIYDSTVQAFCHKAPRRPLPSSISLLSPSSRIAPYSTISPAGCAATVMHQEVPVQASADSVLAIQSLLY